MGLPPQLELLAVFCHKFGHDNMSEQCNNRKYEHTYFHSGMDTQTQTDCAYILLPLNPSSFRVVPNNLASHAHVILPSHSKCISAFQDIHSTHKSQHTHKSQGHSSRCLVKTEVNSFEYQQCAQLETIHTFQC